MTQNYPAVIPANAGIQPTAPTEGAQWPPRPRLVPPAFFALEGSPG